MANNNGHYGDEARFAALSQRVSGIEASVQSLANQFSSFVAKLDERQRTPWGLIVSIAVALLAYVTTIGGLAYAPVWASLGKHDSALAKLADASLSVTAFQDFRASYDANRSISRNEYLDKFNNISATIETVRKDQVPRQELDRVWANYDQRFADQQRQLDQLSGVYNSTFSPRDAILDMRERLDRLERERVKGPSPLPGG